MSIHNLTASSCEAWQPDNFTHSDGYSAPNPEFFIEILVHFVPIADNSHLKFKLFRVQQHIFIRDNYISWLAISNMLSQMDVPYHVQPSMIQRISSCALEIASKPSNMILKTIPIIVYVKLVEESQEQKLQDSEAIEEDRYYAKVSASKISVEPLKKYKIEGFGKQCVICLEEILVGSEASGLPCLHAYHDNCILKWLKNSNFCPLCRFQMPTE
ncbi:putative RING/U-box superfamily protein [Quillaja saponaria]|uniref:RING-type E3 ubiquitin transferase n=1 Tax=Quillaja saponaria TaxID=32244 RepID=A0AAD7LEG1_QUISA|nr:putative RING/U-box superfamily protein [Quillaja saponaria]